MASEKSKASGKNAAYDRLRKAIKEKAPARAYLFYGEESYLRQTYVQQLQELLIPRGSEDFNLHRIPHGHAQHQTGTRLPGHDMEGENLHAIQARGHGRHQG